nr:MAG: hypothetical protein DIU56_03800 [Pseudomonadota bacterium]
MDKRTPITPERWQRMQEIVERALALDPDTRSHFVDSECGEDAELREQVLSLLLAVDDDSDGLEERVEAAIAETIRGPDVPVGRMAGPYRLCELIGRGGMGAVFLAERADDEFRHRVAVKIVASGILQGRAASRFRSERQILARLEHPNIARLLDGGRMEDGTPYLVMEYVQGVRIDEYCATRGLDVRARLKLVQQVCAAVHYAHQNLVVHRDLKPSNILVTDDGVPKLLDFGIAKLLDTEPFGVTLALTRVRERMLTPEYASPEQIRGEPIGTATDVYGLGVLLYELLTGALPFHAPNTSYQELERRICDGNPVPPSVRVRTLPQGTPRAPATSRELAGDLDNIVLRAMHREPERRYPSAAALAEDIQNYLDGRPVRARPDGWAYRTGKFIRRNRLPLSGVTAAVALIAALTTFYTLRLAAERDVAERERQTAASVAEFMIDVFRLANPSENPGEPVTVRQALDEAAERIERDLALAPRLRLTLMREMARAYNGLGLWAKAQETLEAAVKAERAEFGDRHVELARTLAVLGHVHHNQGRFADAERLFAESLSIYRSLGLEHSVEGIRILHSIAANLRSQQRFQQALEYHRRAEQHARALTPPDPATLGLVLMGYGMTYSESGDYASAERYTRASLPLLRDVVYEGIDLYANSLATLANVTRRQYRLAEAKQLHREFVDRQIRHLGKDHRLVARAWNNFAVLLRLMGDHTAAEEALHEALRIFRLHENAELDIAIAHHNLGATHHAAGDLPAARAALGTALDLKRKTAGERSPQLVSTLLELAAVRRKSGDLEPAWLALDEAASIAAEKLDEGDARHAFVLLERGRLQLARGDLESAHTSLREAVTRLRQEEEPARLADALVALGETSMRGGRLEEAREALSEALALRERILPVQHRAIAEARSLLDEALAVGDGSARGVTGSL